MTTSFVSFGSSITSTATASIESVKKAACSGVEKVRHAIWSSPAPAVDPDAIKKNDWEILDYITDIWTIIDSTIVLAKEHVIAVPAAVRVMAAFCASLNILLIPTMLGTTLFYSFNFLLSLPRHGLSGLMEGIVQMAHFAGLTAVFSAIGSLGLKEFTYRFPVSIYCFESVIGAVMPWVGYVLRLSTIPQLMDIVTGMEANRRLTSLEKPLNWKESLASLFLPTHKKLQIKENGETLVSIQNVLRGRANEILEEIEGNSRLYRKLATNGVAFDHKMADLKNRVASCWTRTYWSGSKETFQFARELKERGVVHVTSQILGLTANSCAIMAMILATNVAVAAVFWILSSFFFILQTAHRQKVIN